MKFLSIFYNLFAVYGYALIIMEILKKVQQFDQKSYNPKYAYFFTKITKKLRI